MIGNRRYGFISIRNEQDHQYLEDIHLSKSMRGRGIGSDILQEIMKKCPKPALELTTFIDNPALSLYKRLGFRIKKRNKGTLLMRVDINH